MGQPFSYSSPSSASTPNINSQSSGSNRRGGSGNSLVEDGSITPPSLAAAASIAAHQRLVEELNRVALERNQRVHLDSYSSLSEEEEVDGPRLEAEVPQIVVQEVTPALPLYYHIRQLLFSGRITLGSMLSESDDDLPSQSTPKPSSRCKSTAKHCVLTLPTVDEPESQKSYNEFRMDVLSRSGLIGQERRAIQQRMDKLEDQTSDNVGEEQLFEPSSSSLRSIIRNARLGLGRPCSDDEDDWESSGHFTDAISEPDLIAVRNRTTPNRRKIIDQIGSKTFCVGYVGNGTGIFTASQDNRIRIYKQHSLRKRYVLDSIIPVPFVGWSILDVDVSPDGRHIVYSTWNNVLYQYDLEEKTSWQELPLEVGEARFGVFSIKFNQEGSEIVAGTTNGLFVYSRETDKCVLQVAAHEDDVNAVCFADDSNNLILSSGDDGLVKMWDRRDLGFGKNSPVKVFAGHRDGVTFIDSRRDNRYFLTNSKDQTIKVWDMRLASSKEGIDATRRSVRNQTWDYRWQYTPVTSFKTSNLPGDSSILTLRGHSVLHTLVRARFSPDHTGKRFIYTGCARGGCCVFDLFTGEIHKKYTGHKAVVRDCVWHPYENEFITSSWDGNTFVWRYDRRGPAETDLDSNTQMVQEWDSTDEFDEPIVRNTSDYKKRKRPNYDHAAVRRAPESGSRARMQMKVAEIPESSSDDTDEDYAPSRPYPRRQRSHS